MGFSPSSFAFLRGTQDDRGRPVVDARGVRRGHRAVLVEGRLEALHRLDRRAMARILVVGEHHGPLARGHLVGNDLVPEAARLLRGLGLVLALDRELVLLLARDRVFLGHVLGGDAHVVLVVDVPQAVDDHRVDQLRVAHAKAVARAVQHVRRRAHVLLAARDHDVRVAAGDGLRAQHRRLEAGAADLVDGHRRDHVGQAGPDRRLARRVLPDAGREHLAHDDFGDLVGRDARALQHLPDDVRAQPGRRHAGEGPAELADRGPRRAYDDDVFHVVLLVMPGLPSASRSDRAQARSPDSARCRSWPGNRACRL